MYACDIGRSTWGGRGNLACTSCNFVFDFTVTEWQRVSALLFSVICQTLLITLLPKFIISRRKANNYQYYIFDIWSLILNSLIIVRSKYAKFDSPLEQNTWALLTICRCRIRGGEIYPRVPQYCFRKSFRIAQLGSNQKWQSLWSSLLLRTIRKSGWGRSKSLINLYQPISENRKSQWKSGFNNWNRASQRRRKHREHQVVPDDNFRRGSSYQSVGLNRRDQLSNSEHSSERLPPSAGI